MHTQPFSIIERLGFLPGQRVAILHADDLGMCHGANVAFEELSGTGIITSGAVMVPCPWFPEIAAMAAAKADIDLGVHLTLTSEWTNYRWRPISTTSRSSGLIDNDGYFWHRMPMLSEHVNVEAAELEMRLQIERALDAGIDITHLDSHMGVALLPQLISIYIQLGHEYNLPVLIPKNIREYTSALEFAGISLEAVENSLADLVERGWPLVDHFRMTPGVPKDQSHNAYQEIISSLPEGLTLFAVHPNSPGDIETIVPEKAHFRTEEFRIFRESGFQEFIYSQGIQTIGFGRLRNIIRNK